MWELFMKEAAKPSCTKNEPNYVELLNYLKLHDKVPKDKVKSEKINFIECLKCDEKII